MHNCYAGEANEFALELLALTVLISGGRMRSASPINSELRSNIPLLRALSASDERDHYTVTSALFRRYLSSTISLHPPVPPSCHFRQSIKQALAKKDANHYSGGATIGPTVIAEAAFVSDFGRDHEKEDMDS